MFTEVRIRYCQKGWGIATLRGRSVAMRSRPAGRAGVPNRANPVRRGQLRGVGSDDLRDPRRGYHLRGVGVVGLGTAIGGGASTPQPTRVSYGFLSRGDFNNLESIKVANLALRFLLELRALVALGYWGFKTGHIDCEEWFGCQRPAGGRVGATNVPHITAAVPVPGPLRLVLQVVIFGLAAVGLATTVPCSGSSCWS